MVALSDTDSMSTNPILNACSRLQAITDGMLVDVTRTAQRAGILFPMFLTRAVFNTCVAVPKGVIGQDETARLWEVARMTRFAILRSHGHMGRLTVALYIRNDNYSVKLVKLVAVCPAFDIDDPQAIITLMMADEG